MAKKNGRNKKKKIIVFSAIGLLVIIVVLLVAFGGNKENIIPVQVEEAQKRTITQIVAATGKINPIYELKVTPEVTGEIVDLPVEEGDLVNKGDLLIRIKPDIYIAQTNRAKAQLEAAKATLKIREANLVQVEAEFVRVKNLFEKGLASESQLEAARAAYLQAEGNVEAQKASIITAEESLKEAEENLAKTAIYSPIDGTVSLLNVELGERVLGSGFSQGTHLMTVADLSQMEATVEVDENDVVLISAGDSAYVEVDAFRDTTFLGLVTHIGNTAITTGLGSQDEVTNFEVKVKLVEVHPEIRPGMSCDADIETETVTNVISIPIQSVTARVIKDEKNENNPDSLDKAEQNENKPAYVDRPEPVEVVFVVENNVVKMKPVETGISDDTYIQILSGLNVGEKVVSGPYRAISSELEDDSKVIVRDRNGFGSEQN